MKPLNKSCLECGAAWKKAHDYSCSRSSKRTKRLDAANKARAAKTKPVYPAQAPRRITHVAFVLDGSGSMQGLQNEVVKNYNSQIETLKAEAAKHNIETYVSLIWFDDRIVTKYAGLDINSVSKMTSHATSGSTALLKATWTAVEALQKVANPKDAQVGYLVMVLTDGYENASGAGAVEKLKKLIRETQSTDKWTYAFMVPPGNSSVIQQYGIPPGNVQEWEGTVQGIRDLGYQTSNALGSYMVAAAAGQTHTRSFYTTDMSQVDTQALSKLPDLRNQFKSWEVPKEVEISVFVEFKSGKPYIAGNAYYELTKAEDVQAYKKILVLDKATKALYGGSGARQILGLNVNGLIKVHPGNHMNYKIFVQSTSRNRKLVRGTTLLYEI